MKFTDLGERLSEGDLKEIEAELQLRFPDAVRQCYLKSNGGVPELYVFSNDDLDTVVSAFLPLKSKQDGTAIESYRHLVANLKLVNKNLFPFAVDGGGDYFFVDCSSATASVYFYQGDSAAEDRLIDLKLGFDQFWESLRAE